jgi:Tfp pilus assembly protein PilV
VRIRPAIKRAKSDDGFMLIEVLMSALVLTIAGAGVAAVMATSVATSGEQRHGTEAYALAQQDQARLATMQLAKLNNLDQTREVPLNGVNFKVRSTGLWINNKTSSQVCTEGSTASADYVQVSSVVTWPRMEASEKARIVSIISPSGSQSIDPSHGLLPVRITNANNEPVPHVSLSGTQIEGSGRFSGETDANGCAYFADIPVMNTSGTAKAPNYEVTANGEFAGVVSKDGLVSQKSNGAASNESAQILSFLFDRPSTIPVTFKYRVGSTTEFKPAAADSLVLVNNGMTTSRVFWTTSGVREATVNASPVFPFKSPYSIYAGACPVNNPNPEEKTTAPGAAAMVSTTAPAGGTATPVVIQLPALNLTVTYKSAAFKGARVTVTDKSCEAKGSKVKRVFTTNAEGKMSTTSTGVAEPGLPWGVYELCVSAEVEPGKIRRSTVSSVTVQNLTTGTTQAVELPTSQTGASMCS